MLCLSLSLLSEEGFFQERSILSSILLFRFLVATMRSIRIIHAGGKKLVESLVGEIRHRVKQVFV